jgi:hypothetical protein
MTFDWKALVQRAAPALATALGGPLAGMAVRVLGETLLGDADATEDRVAAAVAAAKPEDLVRLRDADLAFKKHLTDAGIKLEEIAAADRADARKLAAVTGDLWTPRVLALVVVGGFFAAVVWVLAGGAVSDPTTATLVGAVVGYASAKADQVVSFWFGSSAGSRAKTEALERLGSK